MQQAVLPSSYFPPISYFLYLKKYNLIWVDIQENFIKQTYRNRCVILGANGKLPLIIPLKHTQDRSMKNKEICYSQNWQKDHLKSLQSAYQRSPYFEFYEDKFHTIYEEKPKLLIDFNAAVMQICLDILGFENIEMKNTSEYQEQYEGEDARGNFSPKKKEYLNLEKYHQVFEDRHEFQENLSIFDLICNKGPEASSYLNRNINKI